MSPRRSVLITGCSDGSLGAALAIALHKAGLHVYATARNPLKMKGLAAEGIETLALDVLSETSIAQCAKKIPSLDILINNAGMGYSMPISDISIPAGKQAFDLNVWAYIAVTQAFLPLLIKAPKGMVVNQTSLTAVVSVPFQSVYNASKAAAAMFTGCLRLEIEPFGIKPTLPEDSMYMSAKDVLESIIRQGHFQDAGIPADQWAKEVVGELLKKNPSWTIWRGESACLVRVGSCLPAGTLNGALKQLVKLPEISKKIQEKK